MKYKISELTGALLDAAVALAEGYDHSTVVESPTEVPLKRLYVLLERPDGGIDFGVGKWAPSSTWHQGGAIIEREKIKLEPSYPGDPFDEAWCAQLGPAGYDGHYRRVASWEVTALGPTPLIAAMRAYVATKLGDEVELP